MSAGSSELSFVLNGRSVCASGFSPQTTLLDFLRSEGLTGAKEGCAEGECGACTVLLVAEHAAGSAFHPINSCLMFLPMAAGQEIYTVESLAQSGELAAVQKALAEMGGSQCGYCTPGFVMSLFAEHYRPGRVGPCDPEASGGNLCRCTGYRPIRDAALSLGIPAPDSFTARTAQPAPCFSAIRYETAEARFLRPTTLDECLAEARHHPEARWLAGATDLAVESNLRFRRWQTLISLDSVAELHEFSQTPGRIRIGAALPLSSIAARWANPPEAFRQWLPLFASLPIRNRATLGGNLATASPIGDAAPLLMALGAGIHLAGPNGRRQVALDAFFTGYRQTVMEPGEMITAIELPDHAASLTRFYKVAKRRMDDISTVAAAMALDLDGAGRVRHARFGFGGVAATPLRATAAEEAVIGLPWNLATVARAQAALDRSLHPIGDHRGSAEYRLEVSKALLEKLWWDQEKAAA
jgi:xanthine dehydrogenase small subunit